LRAELQGKKGKSESFAKNMRAHNLLSSLNLKKKNHFKKKGSGKGMLKTEASGGRGDYMDADTARKRQIS